MSRAARAVALSFVNGGAVVADDVIDPQQRGPDFGQVVRDLEVTDR